MLTKIINKLVQKKLLWQTNLDYIFWYRNHLSVKKIFPQFKCQPLISVIVPVYNPPEIYLRKCLDSVLRQTYANWELCLVDDCSPNHNIRQIITDYASKDSRVKFSFHTQNGHISQSSNDAIALASGEFIALLDHDDELAPHALSAVIEVLNKSKNTDFIYSDEDKLSMSGIHCDPSFKSDFAYDRLLSNNYICHLSVIRKTLVDRVGGFRLGYEGSQDYDLILRVIEKTKKIAHIPDILYHWRKIPNSTAAVYSVKSYANQASINTLVDHLRRLKIKGTVENGLKLGTFRVKYQIVGHPLVSIIIASNSENLMNNCLNSIFAKTTYQNYEIIIVNNGSKINSTFPKTKIYKWTKKFNYSAVNNLGASKAKGEYLLFLNNDIEIITPEWIENMLEHAQRKDIGVVGAKLLYPNGLVQHAGVYLGVGGIANHNFYRLPDDINQPFPTLNTKDVINNFSAVTGACLMVAKNKFNQVKGFDETLAIAYNDIDLCLKLNKLNFRTVYTPYSVAYHLESISVSQHRDQSQFKTEQKIFTHKWSKFIDSDPFYNPNLPH